MKALRRILDRLHPLFVKGGKYERLYPLYEAGDTFLYTPPDVTSGPAHVRDALDMKRMMITVVVALGPCILMALYNTGLQANLAIEHQVHDRVLTAEGTELAAATIVGWRGAIVEGLGVGYNSGSLISCFLIGALYFVPIFLVTQIAGGLWEVLFSCVRKHEINEGFLVTGMLFPLTLPPTIPLWQVAIGISFGVVIGKEVFGGTGKNFLNPALTARAFLYFAHAGFMSGDKVWTASSGAAVDGYSAATSLGHLASAKGQGMAAITDGLQISWADAFIGTIPGSMGETSTLACLLGAFLLIITRIGSWRIMAGVLIGSMATAGAFYLCRDMSSNPMYQMPPHWHLVVGGLAFGLVFMATDPVSAAMTEPGKWVYGLLIGGLTILVRNINPAFPEGIMLAILFGNVMAPLIDYFFVQANIKRRLKRSVV
ncbi:MAG: NADH:ubiquinone reductase (Na(+)-transporting) subunit B [Planctomycetaceae bacterium]